MTWVFGYSGFPTAKTLLLVGSNMDTWIDVQRDGLWRRQGLQYLPLLDDLQLQLEHQLQLPLWPWLQARKWKYETPQIRTWGTRWGTSFTREWAAWCRSENKWWWIRTLSNQAWTIPGVCLWPLCEETFRSSARRRQMSTITLTFQTPPTCSNEH